MSKSSGGIRKGGIPKIVGFRETEKAVEVKMYLEATIAPNGGFSSSMTRDISTGVKVWIPKTQIENGNISEWIAKNKRQELESTLLSRYNNGRILSSEVTFNDANGRYIKVAKTAKERAYALEKATKVANTRDELMKQAKANGYTVRNNLKTSTLRQMASTKKQSTSSTFPKKDNIVAALRRRGVSASNAWKVVNKHYKDISGSTSGSTKDVVELFLKRL